MSQQKDGFREWIIREKISPAAKVLNMGFYVREGGIASNLKKSSTVPLIMTKTG